VRASTERKSRFMQKVGRNGYRIRTGDYHIPYVIDDRLRLVRIYRISHRLEVYRGRQPFCGGTESLSGSAGGATLV
jgi:hypothetical protein